MQRPYAVIEVPSILGLQPTGVDGLARRLLENGLVARVNARYAGRLEPPTYSGEREPETLTLNAHTIASWSPRLADAIGAVLERREFPLILGGDCSILLGAMLALRRRGRLGCCSSTATRTSTSQRRIPTARRRPWSSRS